MPNNHNRRHRPPAVRALLASVLVLVLASAVPAQECAYVGNHILGTLRLFTLPDGSAAGTVVLPDCNQGPCQLTEIAIHPATRTTYISQFDGNRIWVVDPTGAIEPTQIAVPGGPTDIALSADGSTLFVVTFGSAELVAIDRAAGAETGRIALPSQPRGLAFTSDGTVAATTSRNQNTVSFIDMSSGEVLDSATVDARPIDVAFSISEDRAFVASEDGILTIVEVDGGNIVDTITVGEFPLSIAVDPSGTFVYVANRGDGTVTAVDLGNGQTVSIEVGRSPVAARISATGLLVVANQLSSTLSVIDTTNGNAVGDPIDAGSSPFALAIGSCSATSACVGDCNSNGMISISELVTGVNITLRQRALADCPQFDANSSGGVEISELVRAVRNLLEGCPQ